MKKFICILIVGTMFFNIAGTSFIRALKYENFSDRLKHLYENKSLIEEERFQMEQQERQNYARNQGEEINHQSSSAAREYSKYIKFLENNGINFKKVYEIVHNITLKK